MPFALLIIGLVLLISSSRNTTGDLFKLVEGDFTGPNNFLYWFVAILAIGSIGYVPRLKGLSTAFLTLVIIVLVLTKGRANGIGGGLFEKFTSQLASTATAKPTSPTTSNPTTGVTPNNTTSNPLNHLTLDYTSILAGI